jgi:protein TonB
MKLTLLMFLILISLWAQSQVVDTLNSKRMINDPKKTTLTKNRDSSNTTRKSREIVQHKETSPEFPGGMQELNRFIGKNISHPKDGAGKYITGKAIVRFTVDSLGLVKNPTAVMYTHPFLRDEAIRVFKSVPKWKPGTRDGKPLNVEMVLPVTFQIP